MGAQGLSELVVPPPPLLHAHTHVHTHTQVQRPRCIALASASRGNACLFLSWPLIITAASAQQSPPPAPPPAPAPTERRWDYRSGPSQKAGELQGRALCSISLLIPLHLSFPSRTLSIPSLPPRFPASDFTASSNLYFQDSRRFGTHSFPTGYRRAA